MQTALAFLQAAGRSGRERPGMTAMPGSMAVSLRSIRTDADSRHDRFAFAGGQCNLRTMESEYILFLYPVVLLAYLMLAARWQPRGVPQRIDEDEEAGGQRSSSARHRHHR